jgi:predicted metalloprotease with PDZ domain
MYDEFYVKSPNATYYLKGRGYTQEDFIRVLSDVAGEDMHGFYDRNIRGVEPLPYDAALAGVGLSLSKTPATGDYVAGIVLDPSDPENIRLGPLVSDSPAEHAGLQEGDVILSIGGVDVNPDNWHATLQRFTAGMRVQFRVRRFRRTLNITLDLAPVDVFRYRLQEMPNAPAKALNLRAAWLSGARN